MIAALKKALKDEDFYVRREALNSLLNSAPDIEVRELACQEALRNFAAAEQDYRDHDNDGNRIADYAATLTGKGGLANTLSQRFLFEAVNIRDQAALNMPGNNLLLICGYRIRVLTAQGERAPGGRLSYLAEGKLTRGYAFVAYPSEYGVNGRNIFIMGQDKKIFQKDYGKDTSKAAAQMTEFNPDIEWQAVE